MVSQDRVAEVESVIAAVHEWASRQDDVGGVAVVGSWARSAARMDSDVDVVVLTDNHSHVAPELWTGLLGGEIARLAWWGPVREVRVRRPTGLEVEIGVAPRTWAGVDPIDAGTYRVMADGHRIVYDPHGLLAALSAGVRS
jgi:predicted nucleotidyltransferase